MRKGETDRGLKFIEFTDCNDRVCSLQESSLATNTAIWFGASGHGTRMHLTQRQVCALLPFLKHFEEHGKLP